MASVVTKSPCVICGAGLTGVKYSRRPRHLRDGGGAVRRDGCVADEGGLAVMMDGAAGGVMIAVSGRVVIGVAA